MVLEVAKRNIVVAIDSSKFSENALKWALSHLVDCERDTLYLVAVSVSKKTAQDLKETLEFSHELVKAHISSNY